MSRMRFLFVATFVIALALVGIGSVDVRALQLDARELLLRTSVSESTGLVLFGSCLWLLAMLRRLGEQGQNA